MTLADLVLPRKRGQLANIMHAVASCDELAVQGWIVNDPLTCWYTLNEISFACASHLKPSVLFAVERRTQAARDATAKVIASHISVQERLAHCLNSKWLKFRIDDSAHLF